MQTLNGLELFPYRFIAGMIIDKFASHHPAVPPARQAFQRRVAAYIRTDHFKICLIFGAKERRRLVL
jgi:hypothetical protein